MEADLKNMIEALGLEVEAIKRQGGSHSIEVRGGERKGTMGGDILYSFPLAEELYLRDDSPIRVVAGQEEVDGVIVSSMEEVLLVALERDLGPKIPFAWLISDDSFLIERLKDKLEAILRKEVTFNDRKADETIGARQSRSSEVEVEPRLTREGEKSLNDDQERAIAKALGSDLVYLWGPPGTGKTTVLASIVEGFYQKGLSVLVLSNTNVAVDTALQKIADRLHSAKDEGYQQGAVLRYGPIVKPELHEQKYIDRICLDNVVARLSRSLQVEKEACESESAKQEAEAALLRGRIQDLEKLDEAESCMRRLRDTLQEAKAKQESTRSSLADTNQVIASLRLELERGRRMGSFRRFLSGLNPVRIQRKIDEAEVQRASLEEVLSSVTTDVTELTQRKNEAEQSVKDLMQRHM